MINILTICIITIIIVIGYGLGELDLWLRQRSGRRDTDETFSDPGYSVEVDCRACGKFNRVPSYRLRDRPKCGSCKVRLMPGKCVVLCRMTPMNRSLSAELDAVWKDEDRLWQSLADHVALEVKAKAEARDPRVRVVN